MYLLLPGWAELVVVLRVGSLLQSYQATLGGSCGLLLIIFITQITDKQGNRRM